MIDKYFFQKFLYKKYNKEFGPLNLSYVSQYVKEVDEIIRNNNRARGKDPTKKLVVHYCSSINMYQLNSSVLVGAYMILMLDLSAE